MKGKIAVYVKSLYEWDMVTKFHEIPNCSWSTKSPLEDWVIYINESKCGGLKFARLTDYEIISFDEWNKNAIPKTEFKQGDYIVLLYKWDGCFFKQFYCFKQAKNFKSLLPQKGIDDSIQNYNWFRINFTNYIYWRYATKEEIAEYDRLGKPYDVRGLELNLNSGPQLVEQQITSIMNVPLVVKTNNPKILPISVSTRTSIIIPII